MRAVSRIVGGGSGASYSWTALHGLGVSLDKSGTH